MGYRRIRDELDGHKEIHVNDKRVLRICRKYDIKSNIKWKTKPSISHARLCAGYFHSKVRRKTNFPIKQKSRLLLKSIRISGFVKCLRHIQFSFSWSVHL